MFFRVVCFVTKCYELLLGKCGGKWRSCGLGTPQGSNQKAMTVTADGLSPGWMSAAGRRSWVKWPASTGKSLPAFSNEILPRVNDSRVDQEQVLTLLLWPSNCSGNASGSTWPAATFNPGMTHSKEKMKTEKGCNARFIYGCRRFELQSGALVSR